MDSQSWNRFLDKNGLYMLQEMPKIVSAADRSYPEASRVFGAVAAEVDRVGSPRYLLCTSMFPNFGVILDSGTRDQAGAAVTAAGAAVTADGAAVTADGAAALAWKARHGAFPADLHMAMDHIPADPFDGKPICYGHQGTGFMIYSIGPTGKFNGGTRDKKPAKDEVRFVYPKPPV